MNNIAGTKETRCAIYLRSACGGRGSSSWLNEQERICRAAARQFNWMVLEDYVWKEKGKSGTSCRRFGLESLIAEAKKSPKPFDHVLMNDTSRLSRNFGEALKIINDLACHGVDFYFADQKLNSKDPIFRPLSAASAVMEETYVERLQKGNRRHRKGLAIQGIQSDTRCSEASTVRHIYGLFSAGKSVEEVVKILDAE